MNVSKFSLTNEDISRIRHEICIAKDTAKAVCSVASKEKLSDIYTVLCRATDKLDAVVDYIDSKREDENE